MPPHNDRDHDHHDDDYDADDDDDDDDNCDDDGDDDDDDDDDNKDDVAHNHHHQHHSRHQCRTAQRCSMLMVALGKGSISTCPGRGLTFFGQGNDCTLTSENRRTSLVKQYIVKRATWPSTETSQSLLEKQAASASWPSANSSNLERTGSPCRYSTLHGCITILH